MSKDHISLCFDLNESWVIITALSTIFQFHPDGLFYWRKKAVYSEKLLVIGKVEYTKLSKILFVTNKDTHLS